VLEVELSALARLSRDLLSLGMPLKLVSESPSVTAIPDDDVDMPSLVAARPVSSETVKGLQGAVANRFIEVAYLVDHVRTQFSADDDRAAVIAEAGSLL
jgi:hypothetical protein